MVKSKRLEVVDALRGFAILCILLLHSSNHFLYNVMPEDTPTWLQLLDVYIKTILYFLFEGKAFGIFALLFGFTFGVQCFRALERGSDFRLRFLWRMVLLAGFGFINAAFFTGGDPLVFMAIVSIILPIIARLNTKALIIIACILFLQPIELYKAICLWLIPGYETTNFTSEFYPQLTPYVVNGNFCMMVWSNITTGLKACLAWAFEYGRVSQTPALYITGFLCYKHGLFSNIYNRFWTRLFIITIICVPALYIFKENILESPTAMQPIEICVIMWYNLSFILLLVSSFVLLFRTVVFKRIITIFQIYGKMSLTNFVFQSVVGSFLFYPYGLNLSVRLGIFYSILLGGVIGFIQMLYSKWWLGRFKQGPLEYVWHKCTYISTEKL